MKDGVVQQIDSPLELYNEPHNQFVAGFIGSPSMNFIEGNLENRNGYKFTVSNNMIVNLPTELYRILDTYNDKNITLGIRPEHFSLEESNNYNDNAFLQTEIEVLEPLGNETFLYFTINKNQHIARVDSHIGIKAGDKIKLYTNQDKIYLFDKNGN